MTPAKKTSQLLDAFTDYLRASCKRVTPERISIFETAMALRPLFTVDDLHEHMCSEAYPVTLSTVYNTVQLLVEAGILRCVRLPDEATARYRLAQSDTGHVLLVCTRCGAVKESQSKNLIRFINKYDFPTFSPQSFSLNIYGLCSKCRKINKTKSK